LARGGLDSPVIFRAGFGPGTAKTAAFPLGKRQAQQDIVIRRASER
jgi:hypothetical protein